ncbi:hypothetical protein [Limnofasciculus baicalensis]|uniref:Uncharacterized protein n=1 Tax=Limnofasciculus baicalensis BBK-W-15 TaxID=2699891 RepID=A0AAE3GVE6_9CYAN|nr:hypothetical protein [Limnofasciculus baicalensis]MCP2730671.1 hypothetical protein [Limnofasciculus baicalensis BBK-W-15]
MNIPQVFQKLITLVVVVALVFGFGAPSASAAHLFKAPLGAKANVQYFVANEVGITIYDAASRKTVLWCNNYYNDGAGIEWNSTCKSQEALDASESYVVQGFSKSTSPNSETCWTPVEKILYQDFPSIPENNRSLVPSLIPGNNHYIINMYGSTGIHVAQMTLDGLNLGFEGETNPNHKQLPRPLCRQLKNSSSCH